MESLWAGECRMKLYSPLRNELGQAGTEGHLNWEVIGRGEAKADIRFIYDGDMENVTGTEKRGQMKEACWHRADKPR